MRSFVVLAIGPSLLRPGRGALGYYDQFVGLSVCLSVCPRAYLWNRRTCLHEFCCADPLWPWLGPPLAALRYRGRNLMSTNALFVMLFHLLFIWPVKVLSAVVNLRETIGPHSRLISNSAACSQPPIHSRLYDITLLLYTTVLLR